MKKVTLIYAKCNIGGKDAEDTIVLNVSDKIAEQIVCEMAEDEDNEANNLFNELADVLARAAGYNFGMWACVEKVEDVEE